MPCRNHPYVEEPLWRCSRCADTFCQDCVVEIGGRVYCATCKTEAMRDLQSGVPLQALDLASIGRRFLAFWLDSLILTAIVAVPVVLIFLAVGLPLGMFTGEGGEEAEAAAGLAMMGLQLVLTFGFMAVWIGYEGWMLSRDGQTLGKKIMKIKVVTPEGADVARGQAYMRAALRQIIGIVPCLGLINYLLAFGQERTCIHDQAAKTRVVNWNV